MQTLPIRSLEVLGNEEPRVQLHVFCSRQRVSVDIDACRVCPHFSSEEPRSVICDAPPPSSETAQAGQVNLFIGAGAVAMSVCAGDLIGPRTLAVRDRGCAPPAEAEHRTTPVVILDANDHPVETVVDQDTRGAHCLRESASLHDALDLMIHHHERFVPLVNADGSLVGLLTDLDVLRWVARATRGTH